MATAPPLVATVPARSQELEIWATSVGTVPDPAVALAAAAAGATGILDLRQTPFGDDAARAIDALARGAHRSAGVLVDPRDARALDGALGADLEWLVFAAQSGVELSSAVERARAAGRRVGAVAACPADIDACAALALDALVVQGIEASGLVGSPPTLELARAAVARVHVPVLAWGGVEPATLAPLADGGARGVVLGWQLALTREARVPSALRNSLRAGPRGSATPAHPSDAVLARSAFGGLRSTAKVIAAIRRAARRASETGAIEVTEVERPVAAPPPFDVAIIGMGCVLPGARDKDAFWRNVLDGSCALGEIPADRFQERRFFDPDPAARDRSVSRWGGFLGDLRFDPVRYGIPPSAVPCIEPFQLLALEVVDRALRDAGCDLGPDVRRRTSVILGAGTMGELGLSYGFRAMLPHFVDGLDPDAIERLPAWTEDSFAGILLNVIAGRVANRFDLGGANYTVDAACASSLAAIQLACRELADGSSDLAIAGGCDTMQHPFAYVAFSKAGALSHSGRLRAFDAAADGIVISEGLAAVVLKRRADALRDGDRIYAIVRAVAGGSDGRSKGMTAPSAAGQARTIERAYAQARSSPASVELIEAHGTGTSVGDTTECQVLADLWSRAGAAPRSVAVGSVKSMIGHTKCTAGVAGLMKAALALHHRLLPPTIGVETPNPKAGFGDGPLYVSATLRPWLARDGAPRRASVSAFGFGGTNFHALLEEHRDGTADGALRAPHRERAAELVVLRAVDDAALAHEAQTWRDAIERARRAGAELALADLAFTHHVRSAAADHPVRAALVSTSVAELVEQLEWLGSHPGASAASSVRPPSGIHRGDPSAARPRVAFLFPGQGSQYPGMLRELAVEFGEVADTLAELDAALAAHPAAPISRHVLPPPAFTEEERARDVAALTATEVAQPALGACDLALLRLLAAFGVHADFVAGHSFGELVALHAAGAIDASTLHELAWRRGDAIASVARDGRGTDLGGMLAVRGSAEDVASALAGTAEAWLANLNSAHQTVVSGTRRGLEAARSKLAEAGLATLPVPVACGFHSPLVEPACAPFAAALERARIARPLLPTFANTTGAPYPSEPCRMREELVRQLVSPVLFRDQLEAMYAAGAEVFVEVGPGDVLTKLVGATLRGREHLAVATDVRGRPAVAHFVATLARLLARGVPVAVERLYEGRELEILDLDAIAARASGDARAATDWWVNGGYARRLGEPPRQPNPTPLPGAPIVNRDAESAEPAELDAEARVMLKYLDNIRALVDSHQAIMRAYLGGRAPDDAAHNDSLPVVLAGVPSPSPGPTPARAAPPAPGVAAPPRPAEPRPAPKPLARTLGSTPPPPSASTTASPSPESGDLEARFVAMLADRTGYPAEILDPVANLESELGIDSIKRIEVVAGFRRALLPDLATPPAWFSERITAAANIRDIVAAMRELVAGSGGGGPRSTATASASAVASDDPIELERRFVAMLADRTGYPIEILDPGAPLESELGIDSIKRIEVVAAFRRALLPELDGPPAWFADRVGAASTIREIVAAVHELVRSQTTPGTSAPAPVPAPAPAPDGARESSALARYAIVPVEAPLAPDDGDWVPRGTWLVTDDGSGVASGAAGELSRAGAKALIVTAEELLDAARLGALLRKARARKGRLGGVLHLATLAEAPAFPAIERAAWVRCFEREVKSLFLLLRSAAPELSASRDGAVRILAATRGGAELAAKPAGEATQPWRGGIAGLLKTAAAEWPGARFRAVDFDRPPEAAELLRELAAAGPAEVGYRDARRLALEVRAEPAVAAVPAALPIRPDSVVLVTGGARGITAEVVRELAGAVPCRWVLAGRSELPEAPEDELTRGVADARELRPLVARALERSGARATPVQVEREVRALLARREIERTLAALGEVGATAEYHACDVRDADALGALVADVERRLGPIDALVHGAGVIEDKAIGDKAGESFDRVVSAKLDPLLTLVGLLPPEQLRLVVLFSSVAGLFGNPGQCDYAIANEILNRIAQRLDATGPARVVALNWGPWGETGMVAPEVARQMEARGVSLVPSDAGRRAALSELVAANGRALVVLGEGPWGRPGVRVGERVIEASR